MQFLLDNNVTIDSSVLEEARSVQAFTLLFEHGLDIYQNLSLRRVPLMHVLSDFIYCLFSQT